MNKRLAIKLCLLLTLSISFTSCAKKDDVSPGERFQEAIIDEVLSHTQLFEVPRDVITVSKEIYGSFSCPDAKEVLVICDLDYDGHSTDEKAFVLIDLNTNKCLGYYESLAEYNDYTLLPFGDDTFKLLNIKTLCYSGIYNQEIELIDFSNSSDFVSRLSFDEMPGDTVFIYGDTPADTIGIYGYIYDGTGILFAKGNSYLLPEEIEALYAWNAYEGRFGATKEVYGLE